MKKILSFVVAGVLALGLIGCSGNLHDVVPSRIDLSGGGTPGAFNSWTNTTPWTTVDKASGVYTYEFTATAESAEWKVITTLGDWNSGAYGGEGTELELKVGDKATLVYDNKTGGGKNVKITGLTKNMKYKITVTATELATVEAKVEVAGLPPVPYYFDGLYLVGNVFAANGGANAWSFGKDNLLSGAVTDANTGVVTYTKDITAITVATPDKPELGINDSDWKNKQKGAGVTVNADDKFVKLNGTEGNFAVSGLTAGKPYRVTIQAYPDKSVSVRITPICEYTLKFKLVGAANGTEYFISGTPWKWEGGWPILGWGGKKPADMKTDAELAKRFATANVSGHADFTTEVKVVGKPGDTATWEVKVVSCTTDGADPVYNGDNAKFDVTVSESTFTATWNVDDGTVSVQ